MENVKNGIIDEFQEILEERGYNYYNESLEDIVTEALAQKENLIQLFSKHPNWNAEKLMIQFDVNFERRVDIKQINIFYNWLVEKVDGYFDFFAEEQKREYNICRFILGIEQVQFDSTMDERIAKVNSYNANYKLRNNMKASKAIGKICKEEGWDRIEGYNKEFAKLCDALTPLTIKRHTCISVNPIDFLLMSNGNSWRSCHDIGKIASDASCYSSGCISYMLDGHSFIFYTVDGSYEGEQIEKAPKLQRQIFGYNDEVLAQLRLYPQSNDFGSEHIYDNIRAIVQEVIALCLEKPNRWVKSKKDVEDVCEHGYRATCFPDWYHYNPGGKHCSISTHKERANGKEHRKIVFGAQPICIDCGYRHSQDGSISCCNNYKGYTCRDCGAEIESEDDIIWINEQPYCEGCTTR